METSIVEHRRTELDPMLSSLRAPQVSEFQPLRQRERERAQRLNRPERPPSFLLYPAMMMRRTLGKKQWLPFHPEETPLLTWAEQKIVRRSST